MVRAVASEDNKRIGKNFALAVSIFLICLRNLCDYIMRSLLIVKASHKSRGRAHSLCLNPISLSLSVVDTSLDTENIPCRRARYKDC